MVPKFTDFYIPILSILSDIEEKTTNEISERVANTIGLTEEDKLLMISSRDLPVYKSHTNWAITDLFQGGFIERSKRGVYVITMEGLELLEENPLHPTRETLALRSAKFREFLKRTGKKSNKEVANRESVSNPENIQKSSKLSNIKTNSTVHLTNTPEVNDIINSDPTILLQELYNSLPILRKAGLSTFEIEEKIKELEKQNHILKSIRGLIPILEKIALELNISNNTLIVFNPNKDIKIECDEISHSFIFDDKNQLSIPNNHGLLSELSNSLSVLRKAGLSTQEIETKIKELEMFDVIRHHVPLILDELVAIPRYLKTCTPIHIEFKSHVKIKIMCSSLSLDFNLGRENSINTNDSVTNAPLTNPIHEHSEQKIQPEIRSSVTSGTNSSESTNNSPSSTQSIHRAPRIWIQPNTAKTFAVCGDTSDFTELFKSYGAYKTSTGVWIFMKGKEEGLRKEVAQYLVVPPTTKSKKNEVSDDTAVIPSQSKSLKPKSTVTTIDSEAISHILKYKQKFDKLKVYNFLGITGPHKQVLLLAIFDLIRLKIINTPKIYFTVELKERFRELWSILVQSPMTLGAASPYAHLCEEPFVCPKVLKPIRNYDITWNRQILKNTIEYIQLEKQLFKLLIDQSCNIELYNYLLERYFPKAMETENQRGGSIGSILPTIKTTQISHEDAFRMFLLTVTNSKGQRFNIRSVEVYINALKCNYMLEKIGAIHHSGNIFFIEDIKVLNTLFAPIDKSIKLQECNSAVRSALKYYIKYLSIQDSGDEEV